MRPHLEIFCGAWRYVAYGVGCGYWPAGDLVERHIIGLVAIHGRSLLAATRLAISDAINSMPPDADPALLSYIGTEGAADCKPFFSSHQGNTHLGGIEGQKFLI